MTLDFPDAPSPGDFAHSRLWDGDKWDGEENHWVVSGYPIGAIKDWPVGRVPRYWLPADHREVSRTLYAALYAKLGDRYGAGDGSTTFNLPDTRAVAIIGGIVGRIAGDQRVGAHFHPIIDYGHVHGLNDPGHQHAMWQNAHSHGVPDPGHGHGLSQSAHDHGVGDPGHNHGIHDPGHSHADQGHTWGHVEMSNVGDGFTHDSASIRDGWHFGVDGNWTGIWNDANWTGIGWHGEYAWIGCHIAGSGCWMDAAWTNGTSYTASGASLTVNGNTSGWISFSNAGNGVAGNVQPSMIVTKMIYAGVV